jgi:hypothetical protein
MRTNTGSMWFERLLAGPWSCPRILDLWEAFLANLHLSGVWESPKRKIYIKGVFTGFSKLSKGVDFGQCCMMFVEPLELEVFIIAILEIHSRSQNSLYIDPSRLLHAVHLKTPKIQPSLEAFHGSLSPSGEAFFV